MSVLPRSIRYLWMSQRQIVYCWSQCIYTMRTPTYQSNNHILLSQNKHSNKRKFKEKPQWVIRMHEKIIEDTRLPLPKADKISFKTTCLESCSNDDILSFVWEVDQIDNETTTLLIELWRRMNSMGVEKIISVADIFFMNNVQSLWYLEAMNVYFMEIMDVTEWTPSQLTRFSFHALDRLRTIPPGFCISLENIICRNIDALSLNQLAVICQSFFTSQNRIRSMDLLEKISEKLIQEFDSLNNWYLPIFMKTMRYSNFIKISFYKRLGHILVDSNYLESFRTLAQVMHIAHAYASVRVTHSELFSCMLKTCCLPKYKFRLKDLSKLIWSCGTLVMNDDNNISSIKKILTYLEYNLTLEEALDNPDNLVDLVSGLCFLNIHSDFLLDILFHPRNVSAVIGMSNDRDKLPQLSMIHHSVETEYPMYSGNLLNKNAKRKISNLLGSYPLETEISLRKGLKETADALREMLGEDSVSFTKLLPHFQSSDIYLIWNCLESKFKSHKEVEKSSEQETGHYIRLAIQVVSNMQTSYDGMPLGMLHMKLRQLCIMGFTPILIDPEDAFRFMHSDTHAVQTHLIKMLSEVLSTDLSCLLPSSSTSKANGKDCVL